MREDLARRSIREDVAQALDVARSHWQDMKGARVLNLSAQRAAGHVPEGQALELASTGSKVLTGLRNSHLAARSVGHYYSALRRALRLAGVDTVLWPRAPEVPRKTKERLPEDGISSLIGLLRERGQGVTADLVTVCAATGLRVGVEALSRSHIRLTRGPEYDVLHVTGKGGHERMVPVVDSVAREILADDARMSRIYGLSYSSHARCLGSAQAHLGIPPRQRGFHSLRRAYGSRVYERSGGNLVMAQELLGHADPATTTLYLDVDLAEKAKVLMGST